MAIIGELSGDGITDAIIGQRNAQARGTKDVCRVFVVFGKIGNSEAAKELSDLNGTDGCRLNDIRFEGFARNVGPGGDANGDGFTDVIVEAGAANPYGREDAGEAYLVFGQSSFAKSVLLEALDGSDGVRIAGERIDHRLGRSTNISGNFNGDGFDDMIIGAYTSHRELTATTDAEYTIGRAFVVFGSGDGATPVRNLRTLDASEGFALGGIAAGDRASAMSPA